jgi:hypothetical protein
VTLVKEGNHTGEPTTWGKKFWDGEWFDYVQNLIRREILVERCRILKPVEVKKN